MSTTGQETKAQRVERLKREKNAWEHLDEIREFARKGYESIPAEWLGTYFRPWGVYTQGDGAGAMGGKGGEGKAVPYFMVRIRVPNGLLVSHQVRTLADAVERYARGVADLTVRQNVQLHWVTIESLPELLDKLWRAGLTTMGSCGDDTRNITGCPLAGIDGDEICDASPLVAQATSLLVGNPAFYNLPRKFKICITGCRVWCSYPEVNDVGLTAVTRTLNGHPEVGFSLRVGGGLSTEPLFGQRLNSFVCWNQVIPVIQGVAEIFRDADVLRESRERARLKYLFLRHGWTAARFMAELERRIGFKLDPMVEEEPPADTYRDHVGFTLRNSLDTATWVRQSCAGASRHSSCSSRPTLQTASPRANCAPPTCRICSSPMSPTIRPANWLESWTASDYRPAARVSHAVRLPVRARSSANSRLQKPRPSRAGWWRNSKIAYPSSTSR